MQVLMFDLIRFLVSPLSLNGPTNFLFRVFAIVAVTAACSTTQALPDPLAAGWEGKTVCENLHEDSEQRILRCTFPPNVGHERHFHRPNFGYAIAGGRIQMKDDSGVRVLDLVTGSSFSSEGTPWHEVLNIGDTTIVYLIVERK